MKALLFFLSVLLAIPVARADQVKALTRGDHALAAFYQAIATAQKTIDFTTYEIEPCDAVGKVLLDAIAKKAKSGVKVRIVTESYSFKDPKRAQFAAWAAEAGKPRPDARESNIEVRKHGTSAMIAGDIPRAHGKFFVVDGGQAGATLITGGRNLTDEYFGLSAKLNYLDQDLLVRGQAASDAGKYFNELWGESTKVAAQGAKLACIEQLSARDKAVQSWVQGKSGGVLSARPTHSCSVDFEHDSPRFMARGCGSGPTDLDHGFLSDGECFNGKRTTGQVLRFLSGTQGKLLMSNQYFFPKYRVRVALEKLRDRKKTVEIFSNATADLPDMPTHERAFTCYMQSTGYQMFKGTLKVRMLTSKGALRDSWELSQGGKWRIHTKSAIRDDRDVLVSSWNIDPRSYQTNLESGAVVTGCPGLVADINVQYDQLLRTHKADEHCVPCKADFNRQWMSDSVFCGGTPDFY